MSGLASSVGSNPHRSTIIAGLPMRCAGRYTGRFAGSYTGRCAGRYTGRCAQRFTLPCCAQFTLGKRIALSAIGARYARQHEEERAFNRGAATQRYVSLSRMARAARSFSLTHLNSVRVLCTPDERSTPPPSSFPLSRMARAARPDRAQRDPFP